MSAAPVRDIRGHEATRVLPDLLQSLFLAELISPSKAMWLISPWVSDIEVLSNEAGEVSSIVPSWETRRIRLSEVLMHLLGRGIDLTIATRSGDSSSAFLKAMEGGRDVNGGDLTIRFADRLHEKGLLADHYYLSGSLNFTWNGITMNEELAHLYVDPSVVAANRIALMERWG